MGVHRTSSRGEAEAYAVGGTVLGLAGAGLTLQNNLSDSLAVTADGPDRVEIRTNTGGGTFGAPVSVLVGGGSSPHSLAAVTASDIPYVSRAGQPNARSIARRWCGRSGSALAIATESVGAGIFPSTTSRAMA